MQEAVSILKLYAEENSMDEENSKQFFHSIATLMSNMLREVSLTVKNSFIEQFYSFCTLCDTLWGDGCLNTVDRLGVVAFNTVARLGGTSHVVQN